jgi:hypothetical protein
MEGLTARDPTLRRNPVSLLVCFSSTVEVALIQQPSSIRELVGPSPELQRPLPALGQLLVSPGAECSSSHSRQKTSGLKQIPRGSIPIKMLAAG